ncbi:MAG: glycosyltransferase, partial [Candidatus Latescibacterota bacterium]
VGGDVALYFNVGDTKSLQGSIKVLLEKSEDVSTRGEAGRRRVDTHFNWDSIARDIEGFYLEICERRLRSK